MKKWLKRFHFIHNLHSRYILKIPFNWCKKKIVGQDNSVDFSSSIVWKSSINIEGSNNKILLKGSKLIQNLSIKIIGDNNLISIGENCWLKNSVIWIEGNGNICQLGKGTTIESAELFLTEQNTTIEIGEDCMLSDSIVFRTGDSHSILDIDTGERINNPGDIFISNHVWIGQGVTVLKNTFIGSGSVIGTRSVVNKRFEDENIIIAGVPSRKVKSNVKWTRERLVD